MIYTSNDPCQVLRHPLGFQVENRRTDRFARHLDSSGARSRAQVNNCCHFMRIESSSQILRISCRICSGNWFWWNFFIHVRSLVRTIFCCLWLRASNSAFHGIAAKSPARRPVSPSPTAYSKSQGCEEPPVLPAQVSVLQRLLHVLLGILPLRNLLEGVV